MISWGFTVLRGGMGGLRVMGVLIGAAFLGACSLVPTSGPASYDIRTEKPYEVDSLPYAVVRITPEVEGIVAQLSPRISGTFPDRRVPKELRFGVGDIVAVSVFEAAAGGLFIPAEASVRPGNFIALPNQAVDSNGFISVPYAGTILAKGRTPPEVQVEIVNALKNRAIDPQAVVTLVEQRTSLLSVLGEVNNPSRFPASPAGERLIDTLTRAGGPKGQGFDTWVMVERNGKRGLAPFGALVYEPANNIWVHPDDTIYVYREPQTFVAFGASGSQGQFNFDAWRLSLAEALAKAGGLNDNQADPASVFLYRGETRELAEHLGVNVARFAGPIIPIVYNLNLRDPAGYFLATKFQMRNKDVIYSSNNPTVEAAKAMQFFRLMVATVNDPISAAVNVYSLKFAIAGTPPVTVTQTVTAPTTVTTH
jgi:polysaccharide export outer membrane protein